VGLYVPFARSRAARETNNDPRPSIEERYASREHYLGLFAEATIDLNEDGYLLGEDLPLILESAGERWEFLTGDR
jgi:hypothetical protein